jgi:hypothetical protein
VRIYRLTWLAWLMSVTHCFNNIDALHIDILEFCWHVSLVLGHFCLRFSDGMNKELRDRKNSFS